MSELSASFSVYSQRSEEEQVIWKNESVRIFWRQIDQSGSRSMFVSARVEKWRGMICREIPVYYRSGYGKPVEITYKMLIGRDASSGSKQRYSLQNEDNPFNRYLTVSIASDRVEVWPSLEKLLGEKTLSEMGFEMNLGMPFLSQEELSEEEFWEFLLNCIE